MKKCGIVAHPTWDPTVRELARELHETPDSDCLHVSLDGLSVEVRLVDDVPMRLADSPPAEPSDPWSPRAHCGFPVCVGGPDYELLRPSVEARFSMTHREFDVARRIFEGYSNEEIAEELGVAVGTIKRHVYNLYNKTGVDTRAHFLYRLRVKPTGYRSRCEQDQDCTGRAAE